jgi:DNA-directed RNA polymerase specialized sigma24 family protein
MGKVANTAIRRRRRRRTDELNRVATTGSGASHEADLVRRQQRLAVAELRRAARTQRLAREAISSAEERGAAAARTLADQGLAQTEIAATCGIPLWTVRRLLALTTPTDRTLTGRDL